MRFLCFTLIFALTACGNNAVPDGVSSPSTEELNHQQEDRFNRAHRPYFVSWDDREKAQSLFEFITCENCPTSFGQLITKTVEIDGKRPKPTPMLRTGNCQGSFIGEDLFLTSRHCLPADLQKVGKDCRGRVEVLMPALADSKSELITCKEVVDLIAQEDVDEKVPQPDWALLRMNTKLETRKTSYQSEGIEDSQSLLAWVPVVDPVNEKFNLQKITCVAIQKSLRLPEFLEKQSPIALLKCDRDITKGFSGTVLFRQSEGNWEATAVVSHLWDTQMKKEEILASQYIVASNLSCLPIEGQDLPEACQFSVEDRERLKEKIIIDHLTAERDKIFRDLEGFINDDKQPVVWATTPLDRISELPEGYPDYLNSMQRVHYPHLRAGNRKYYFRALIPIYAKCVKKEVLTNEPRSVLRRGLVPVISLSLVKSDHRQVQVRHQKRMLPIEVMGNRDAPNTFIMSRRGPLLDYVRPRDHLMAERFTHLNAQIPICP